jgi:hypothetical protein
MKISFILQGFMTVLILAGCSAYQYKGNVKQTELTGGRPDANYGYVYGVYGYTVKSPLFFGHEPYLSLDIVSKSPGSGSGEYFISLTDEKGYFFANIPPGDYTLHRIILNMGGQDYDSVVVDKDFTVSPGLVFYFGNIKTKFLYNTQPFVWWGIKSVDDEFESDAAGLAKDFSGIQAASLFNGYASLGSVIKPFEKADYFVKGGSPVRAN